jgi:ketosteroid isomerase-like protein
MKETDANIESVTKAFGAIVEGKLDDALAQFDNAAKWNVAEVLPEKGRYDGKEAIEKMLAARRERFHGGYKFVHLTVHSTNTNVFAEYTRTSGGEAEGEHCIAVFEMVVGKIREVREFVFRM